jgi:hypothetical protein
MTRPVGASVTNLCEIGEKSARLAISSHGSHSAMCLNSRYYP